MTTYKRVPQPNPDLVKDFRTLLETMRQTIRANDSQATNLNAILNQGMNFDDNFDSRLLTFTSSATPDAENTVAHDLGRIPTGFIVTSQDKGAVVYIGATAWTATNVYLKVNTATVVVSVIVF